jgi:hypothetical protein
MNITKPKSYPQAKITIVWLHYSYFSHKAKQPVAILEGRRPYQSIFYGFPSDLPENISASSFFSIISQK